MDFRKTVIALAVAAVVSCAVSFDISFALTGCASSSLQQSHGAASPWVSFSGSCASGQTIDTRIGSDHRNGFCLVAPGSGSWSELSFLFCPRRLNAGDDSFMVCKYSSVLNGFAFSDLRPFETNPRDWERFGSSNLGLSNVVFTLSGNPYSHVWNLTSSDLELNGVTIPSGSSRLLYLPIRLAKWPASSTDAARYYITDIDGNAVSYIMDFSNSNERGCFVNWSGDFIIREHGWPGWQDVAGWADEPLVRSDESPAVLHGVEGLPLRSKLHISSTNLLLVAWWDFSHDVWGASPRAYVNGLLWCPAHSTSHIFYHPIAANDFEFDDLTGEGDVELSLSLTPEEGFSGGACTMRVWDNDSGDYEAMDLLHKADYYEAAHPLHRAEVAAGTETAKFKVTVNIYKGTWKVEPL